MFSRIFGFLIFTLNILLSEHCPAPAKVLSLADEGKNKGYIETEGKSTKGKGFSFCTWIKNEGGTIIGFQAKNYGNNKIVLRSTIDVKKGEISALTGREQYKINSVVVSDSKLKDIESWFHVCIALTTSTVKFYLNGAPIENYVKQQDVIVQEIDDLDIKIGDVFSISNNGSLYQTNVFDREVTADEAKQMYKGKAIEGNVLKWTDITSQSADIQFKNKIMLEDDDLPCPDGPSSNFIGCSSGNSASCSTSGNPGSSSGDPGSSSGDPGSSSGDSDQGSTSGNPGSN